MWPWKEKPKHVTVIYNVLHEELYRLEARDLVGANLKGLNLAHADLRGQWLDSANLEDANLLGADVRGCSFARAHMRNACLAYARIEGASFRQADLEGADLLYTDIKRARFDGATIGPTSTIPGVYAGARREW